MNQLILGSFKDELDKIAKKKSYVVPAAAGVAGAAAGAGVAGKIWKKRMATAVKAAKASKVGKAGIIAGVAGVIGAGTASHIGAHLGSKIISAAAKFPKKKIIMGASKYARI